MTFVGDQRSLPSFETEQSSANDCCGLFSSIVCSARADVRPTAVDVLRDLTAKVSKFLCNVPSPASQYYKQSDEIAVLFASGSRSPKINSKLSRSEFKFNADKKQCLATDILWSLRLYIINMILLKSSVREL